MSNARVTAASGARFGRINTAIAVKAPANSADRLPFPAAESTAPAQHEAAGTSLIGWIDCSRNVGLNDSSRAAIEPASESPRRKPTRQVKNTSSAPKIGTSRYAAPSP